MTRIGPSGPDTAALQDLARRSPGGARHEDELSSRGHRHEAGEELARHGMRFGQSGAGLDGDERQAHFLQSVRRALADGHAGPDEAEAPKRLLAVAGEALASTLSLFAPAAPVAAEAQPLAPSTADRVEAIASRVEATIRAELMVRGGEGLSLRLDLGTSMPGVSALTVAMSADVIEITLARSGAELPPDYAAAAQALADRLQARFSKKIVRVVETDAPASAEERPGRGLDDIGRLLANRDERS